MALQKYRTQTLNLNKQYYSLPNNKTAVN